MTLRTFAHGIGYLLFTIALTCLGVTAWMINTLRDLAAPRPRTSKTQPDRKAERKPESQLSGRSY